MKPETLLILAALGAAAFFLTRRRAPAALPFTPTNLGPITGGMVAVPQSAPKIKKGAAPSAQAPPVIPVALADASTYLQPIGSCELGSGIPGTLYLNQFGEEVCA